MPLLRISNWNGITERRDGTLGEALQGFAYDAEAVDFLSYPGRLTTFLDRAETNFAASSDTFYGITSANTRMFAHGLSGLWEYTFGTATWTIIGGTSGSTVGVEFLDDYLYYGTGIDDLSRFGPISGAPAEALRAANAGGTDIFSKSAFIWSGKPGSSTVSGPSISSDDGTTTGVDDLRLQPAGADVRAIGETPDLLLIGVKDRVHVWDMFSESWNFDFPVEGHVEAYAYAESTAYIITTEAVYAYFQGERRAQRLFNHPPRFRGDDEHQFMSLQPKATAQWNDYIVYGTYDSSGTVAPWGLWAFPKVGLVERPKPVKLRPQFTTSSGSSGIYAMHNFTNDVPRDNELHWSEVDASGTNRVYKMEKGNDRQNGFWTSQWYDFAFPDYDKEVYKLEVVTEPLPAGTSVTVETATDYGASFTTQLTHSTAGEVKREIPVKGVRGRRVQFRVSLNANGTSAPRVTDLVIGYRVLPRTI